MENQNDNSTNNTFQQAEVVTPVENKVVEETKKEKNYWIAECLLGGELHDYVKGNRKNLLWKRN